LFTVTLITIISGFGNHTHFPLQCNDFE